MRVSSKFPLETQIGVTANKVYYSCSFLSTVLGMGIRTASLNAVGDPKTLRRLRAPSIPFVFVRAAAFPVLFPYTLSTSLPFLPRTATLIVKHRDVSCLCFGSGGETPATAHQFEISKPVEQFELLSPSSYDPFTIDQVLGLSSRAVLVMSRG
ncbi:uncharacterized protein EV420DRAFT_1532374 [Desarmillaria tabescens]|uniref:Uncharacterized protein n=1 Tax=Armillaria tabescens TaxID=1929756 RepID=A0AA39TQG8_ARMTA|nr:uncharacterized protein EV420DRAFT_1532374 [Desarmillaria tabescens]KAK0460484.1 hypothetical protein EV420DRAFT_1532374 [Desarmillaria tabescens]